MAYCVLFVFGVKSNPFEPMLFISYPVETSSPDDPRYAKGWLDIVFIAYHIIVYSFVRQFTILKIIFPVARKLGIKKQAKLDRFGEQAYSMLYYGGMGFWGIVRVFFAYDPESLNLQTIRIKYIMQFLPTWWYKVEYFWIGKSFLYHPVLLNILNLME